MDPTYEAVSLLRAEPTMPDIYGPGLRSSRERSEIDSYLQTQLRLIKSDRVLEAALARPEISQLPMIRSSKHPKAQLRGDLLVTIVGDNTYLIRVVLGSRDAAEAATIVNAVVDAYLEQHNAYQRSANKNLKQNLESERTKLEAQISTTREKLAAEVRQGNAPVLVPQAVKPVGKGQDEPMDPSLLVVTQQQFRDMTSWLLKIDFELMDARARLETARRPESQSSPEKIRELESAAEEVKRKRNSYTRYLAQVRVASAPQEKETLEAQLLTQDLQHLKRLQEVIKSKLAQLDFEIGQESYRITVQDKAAVPSEPADNKRLKYMMVAPVGVLFGILGLSLLMGLGARRATGLDAGS